MLALPGLMGVVGLRVPGSLAYRHFAIRLVSAACKMAFGTSGACGPYSSSGARGLLGSASGERGASCGAYDEPDRDFEPEVVSAFGEAFNNIAVHSYRGVEPGQVHIEVDWDDDKLAITLIDSGHTYDPATIAAPDLDALPERGMGLFIMSSCMDEVDYRAGPPNVLRMIKHRRREGVLPPPPAPALARPAAGTPAPEVTLPSFEALEVPDAPDAPDASDIDGDRGSGVEIIGRGGGDAPRSRQQALPDTHGDDNWRMKAVGEDDRTAEVSRRK